MLTFVPKRFKATSEKAARLRLPQLGWDCAQAGKEASVVLVAGRILYISDAHAMRYHLYSGSHTGAT
jgi:hypothetical protein